jgi:hypothetical protein
MTRCTVEGRERYAPRRENALEEPFWKHSRQANAAPKNTPPLFSRSRLHLPQLTSGALSWLLPGSVVIGVTARYRRLAHGA